MKREKNRNQQFNIDQDELFARKMKRKECCNKQIESNRGRINLALKHRREKYHGGNDNNNKNNNKNNNLNSSRSNRFA